MMGSAQASGSVVALQRYPVKSMMGEALNAVEVTRSKKYSGIRIWGLGIAKRRGLRRAAVAVARKLAVLMHRIWTDGTEYRWQREAAVEA
jgi:transposase